MKHKFTQEEQHLINLVNYAYQERFNEYICPECSGDMIFDEEHLPLKEDDLIDCPHCIISLQVTAENPIILTQIYEVETYGS